MRPSSRAGPPHPPQTVEKEGGRRRRRRRRKRRRQRSSMKNKKEDVKMTIILSNCKGYGSKEASIKEDIFEKKAPEVVLLNETFCLGDKRK